jgi:AraC family transcriptional regulator
MGTTTADIEAWEEPFFARRDRLDVYEHLRVRSWTKRDMVACQVRRDQPGLGLTTPHPVSATFLCSIFIGQWNDGDIWCDERHLRRANTPANGFGIFDLRRSWVTDLQDPFAALHVYVPLSSFEELTDDLGVPPIETLICPLEPSPRDDVMLYLTRALLPAMERPREANALFVDHVFAAIRVHLAQAYGGLRPPPKKVRGGLAPWQERRVKEMLLDDLQADLSLSELAAACGISVRHLARAFKATTGLPPHRWLLRRRVDLAKELLEGTDDSLSGIALASGFADQSHLIRVFQGLAGSSPGAWRRQRRH